MEDIFSCDVSEKSLYLKQIQYLEEQLERCQLKYEERKKQMKSLVSEFDTLEIDKKEVTTCLKLTETAKEKVDKVVAQLQSQQREVEQDIETLKMQQNQQRRELQDKINELKSHIMMKASKFETHKEQLMSDMESLVQQHQATINSLKEQHEAATNSMKEKHEADFNSLKKEAESEREIFMDEALRNAENCLEEKTSESLKDERAQHSKTMEQRELLLKENTTLWREKYDLQDLCCDTKTEIKKVTKQSLFNEKDAGQLRSKNKKLRAKLKDCIITQEVQEQTLTEKEADMANERQHLTELCCQKIDQVEQLGVELHKERNRARELEIIIWEAVVIHRCIVTSEKTPKTEAKMHRMLEVLESCDLQVTDSALNDAIEKTSAGQGPWTGGRPTREKARRMLTDPLFLLAKFRPGDLGFIPRPRWKHHPAASGPAAAQSSNNLSTVRKHSVLLEHPRLNAGPNPFLLKWIKTELGL
ncbi:cilia- and flagella-associated protein 157-like [Scomber scombrus]